MNLTAPRTTHPSLVEHIWPQMDRVQESVLILAGSWLIALTAHITIPLRPVPITGQTFGVLLIAALLGARRGTSAALIYLLQGAAGIPVFAGGAGGLARFAGPTGGYLLGFVLAAFVVGWLSERGWDRRFVTTLLAMLLGNAAIYAIGLPWLAAFAGWETVFKVGLLPFLAGDALKIVLAAMALPQAWTWVNTRCEE